MKTKKSIQTLSILLMVLALTVLACQGAAGFNPFATATPTPTATFTPTLTPSPTPTSAPSPTPRPTGKLKQEQPDGTTLFIDYDGSYQIAFPKNWTLVTLDKDDIEQILSRLPDREQSISSMIDSVKKADINNLIRIVGFNFPAQQGVYTPNVSISYDTNALTAALPLKNLIDATTAYFPSLNIKVLNSEITKTSSGVEIGAIEAEWSMKATSKAIDLHQRQIFFKSGKGLVVLTFTTLQNATVDLSQDVETIIESITLLE